MDGKPSGSAGVGSTGGNASSTTTAGISGIAGNTTVRTGDAETGLQRIFKADKVQKEINAQVAITQAFCQQASKTIGDYAQTKTTEAKNLRNEANNATDPERAKALNAQAKTIEDNWGDNGTLRLLAHTVVGGLTGGASGAAGAAAGTLAAPMVAEALRGAGVDGPLATTITALASTAAGALAAGTTGAAAGFNEVVNNYLNHPELVSKKDMQERCSKGNDLACKAVIAYNDLDLKRNAALDACVGVVSTACSDTTTKAANDIQGLAGYASDVRDKFAQTGEIKYKQKMESALGELKEAAAGLKNYYYVLSGGNSDTKNPDPNYVKYKILESMTNGQDLGAALTGAPTANPSNKAMGRLTETSAPPLSAADKRKAEIEINARTDDAQQYVNMQAPVNVPNTTTRKDNDFSSPINDQGKPKASIDTAGNLNAANPEGTGSIQSHVRGGQSENTPYISTTDNTIAVGPKNYGADQATVDTRQLQRDINNGTVDSTKTQIVPPAEVQANLQQKIDAAQTKFDANPTERNEKGLTKAREDLANAVRDGECLVKGCVPAPYIQLPAPALPIAPTPSINPILIAPAIDLTERASK